MFRQPYGSGEEPPSAGLGRRSCRAQARKASDEAIRPSASGPGGRSDRTFFAEQGKSNRNRQDKKIKDKFHVVVLRAASVGRLLARPGVACRDAFASRAGPRRSPRAAMDEWFGGLAKTSRKSRQSRKTRG